MSWQEDLWTEFDGLSDIDQIRTAAIWIEYVTHTLSPELARRRRAKVEELLRRPDMDPTKLAESIGAKRSTIKRLNEEARAYKREQDRRAA
jgi:hypothetical protein